MNRTGLFIALALWLVIGVVFGLYPELDLKLAALFFDPETKTFPLKLNEWAGVARDAAMWVAWAFVLPPLVALVVKMIRPDRPLMVSGRAIVFLLVTIIMSAGILTNLTIFFHPTSLFNTLIMLILFVGGLGLIGRSLLPRG